MFALSVIDSFLPFGIKGVEALSISDVVEVYDSPTGTDFKAMDVNSTGYVFGYSGDSAGWSIYGSDDSGRTWTQLSTGSGSGMTPIIFVDSNDYVWAQVGASLRKFDKQGQNPSKKLSMSSYLWHFTEAPNGSMYANQYSGNNNYVYGSHDGGDTWSIVWNLTDFGESAWHTHTVRTDPFTGDLYVATGDVGDDVQIWHYNHTTTIWTQLVKGRTNSSYPWVDMWLTDFAFDANYVYGGADAGVKKVQRWVRGNSPWTAQGMISAGGYGKKTWNRTNFVKQFENVDGILLFGTADGILMGSWDGEHWLTFYAIDDATAAIENIARRRAKDGSILAVDNGYGKIIKLHIDAEVMVHLYFNEFVSESGSTAKYSQIIRGNNTHYVDLSGYVLSDAQLTLYGVSRKNYLANGTFEKGGTAEDQGWRLYNTNYGDVYVDTNNPYEGVYCLNSTVTAPWQGITTTYFRTGTNTRIWRPLKSHIAVVSFWARTIPANASTDGIQARFDFGNGTNTDYDATTFAVNDTWRFI